MSFNGFSQVSLKGKIIDKESKEALASAIIEVHETGTFLELSPSGDFVLELESKSYTLHFLANGYLPKELHLNLKKDTILTIEMQPSYQEMKEVLIEDFHLKKELAQSSLNIEQIRLDQISKAEQNSLSESLEKKAGLQAFNTGVGVSKPIIRGLMATRVAVINQGLKQEGQQWGMDHGLEIDPFSVGRIQIIKGAASLQYGSSASGGVLNIMEDVLPVEGFGFTLNSRFKTNNQSFGNSLRVTYKRKKHHLNARFSLESFEDFKVPANNFIYNGFNLPLVDGTLKNTAGNSKSFGITYGYSSNNLNLRLNFSNYDQKIGLFPGATGIPRAFDLEDIGNRKDVDIPNQGVNHQSIKLSINQKLGKKWLQSTFGFQRNLRAENSNPLAHGFLQLREDDILAIGLDLTTLSHKSHYSWGKNNWKSSIGIDQQYQKNKRSGWEFLLPNFSNYEGGIYGLAENKINSKFIWNAGLRLQYAFIKSEEHRQGYFANLDSLVLRAGALNKTFFNYSFSTGFTYIPNNNWNHKLNVAKSFRIPVAAELLSNGIHHGTFRHEMGDAQLEIENGIQVDWGSTYQKGRLGTGISPFFNYFSNYIYLNPSGQFSPLPDAGQVYTYSSTEAIHTGGEIFLDYQILKNLNLSYAFEYVYNHNLKTDLPLPFSPPLSQLISSNYELLKSKGYKWNLVLDYRITASQNEVDRNESPTKGFQLLHLKSSFEFKIKNSKINLGISARNLLNTAYLSHLSRYRILNLPEQGRNLIFQTNISF